MESVIIVFHLRCLKVDVFYIRVSYSAPCSTVSCYLCYSFINIVIVKAAHSGGVQSAAGFAT